VVTHVPPRLSTRRDDVNEALDSALARALEKEPAKRFDSAGSFAAALRACRTWSEHEATAELGRVIQEDFASAEMPQLLNVETLQTRDAAWRAALPSQEQVPLRSSRPPGRRATHDAKTPTPPPPAAPARVEARSTVPAPALTRKRQRSFVMLGLGLGLGLLVVGGAVYPLLHKQAEPPPPRFLLIEKQADGEPEPVPSAAAATPPSPASAITQIGALPTALAKPARASDGSSAASSGSSLTSAFQKQRGRVEACFRQNSSEATPQLTLRFQVEASGAVRTAELSPPTVAASALGSCILGVARATHFPAGDAPISFTIPITARKTSG